MRGARQCRISRRVQLHKGKAKLVEGGIDHGTSWKDLMIPPTATAEEVADVLCDSFDEELIEKLVERQH